MQLLKDGRQEYVERIRLGNRHRPTGRRRCKCRICTSRSGRDVGAERRHTRLRGGLPKRGRYQTGRHAGAQNIRVDRGHSPSFGTTDRTSIRRRSVNHRAIRDRGQSRRAGNT